MSLYNMVRGFNRSCIYFLPMLGRTQYEWPRFRDCFLSDDETKIDVFTRVGGGNRGQGYGEEELYKDPNFVTTWDDEYDDTYATYQFNPPEKWKDDFKKLVDEKYSEVSDEYVEYVKNFYPTLAENGMIDLLFGRDKKDEMVKE